MESAAENNATRGPVAKVGLDPTVDETRENKPDPIVLDCSECPGRAGTASRDALETAHLLAAGWLAFGTPLELWSLVARLVVARGLPGTTAIRIDERFSVLVSRQEAGSGALLDLGSCIVTVPAGCALLVERVEPAPGREWIDPVCLIEPYAWALGAWATRDEDETATLLVEHVLPALQAATLRAEQRRPRPRFESFADFLESLWAHGAANIEGGAS